MNGRIRRAKGFTLIEVMVVVALLGVVAALGGMALGSLDGSRAKGAARSVADLLMVARQEAIRTGDNHAVFFEMDAGDNGLTGPSGRGAVALLIRDADGDGVVDSGEAVEAVYATQSSAVSWGSALAGPTGTPAPNDNPGATFPETDPDFACCSFLEPGGDPARWVVFLPDGIPRAFSVGPFTTGAIPSGNGAVYVTTGDRDYAVVLAPLGGVRVHGWDKQAGAWIQ